MSTSKQQIEEWFNIGREKKATHMFVICDSFDHSDYPVYVMRGESPSQVQAQTCRPNNMQRLMECYALHKDFDQQKKLGKRAMDFDVPPLKPPN